MLHREGKCLFRRSVQGENRLAGNLAVRGAQGQRKAVRYGAVDGQFHVAQGRRSVRRQLCVKENVRDPACVRIDHRYVPDDATVVFPAFRRAEGGGQVADRHPQLVFNGAQFFGHFKFVGDIGEHPPQRFAIERNICLVGDALQPQKGAAADAAVRHVKSTPAFSEAYGKIGIGNFPFVPRAFGGTIVPNFIQ